MNPLTFLTQHFEELSAALAAVKVHQSQVQTVCGHLVSLPASEEELDYTRLVWEAEDEIKTLLKKVSQHLSQSFIHVQALWCKHSGAWLIASVRVI